MQPRHGPAPGPRHKQRPVITRTLGSGAVVGEGAPRGRLSSAVHEPPVDPVSMCLAQSAVIDRLADSLRARETWTESYRVRATGSELADDLGRLSRMSESARPAGPIQVV